MSGLKRDVQRLERIVGVFNDLRDCIERNGITRETILTHQDYRWMVSMPLYDITEQVARLSDEFMQRYPIDGFKSIVGMRNRISHGYETVGFDYIADAVLDDLPVLSHRCEQILAELKGTD